ncbi:hypothetical protein [Actinoplanes aureus]|uniref:Uncharacterized protein n=1 Tax=Actinoplanes aureus TaxID=2792083 RepID=A0A931CMQ1_9ACTN|nr:hypothetical protein [Actinoplanes aureus]MBG0569163.1 hypothetical protein [Actinoplanes aureus]
MSAVRVESMSAAAAVAVLEAVVAGLREYEIGPHAAIRIARALEAAGVVLPDQLVDALDGDEGDALTQVEPETVADALEGVVAKLHAGASVT